MPIITRGYTSNGISQSSSSTVSSSGTYDIPAGGIPESYLSLSLRETIAEIKSHMSDQTIHSSPSEETFWGNKLNYKLIEDEETLRLNRN